MRSLHVDYMIFTRNNLRMFVDFKKAMTKEFEMTDIGQIFYLVGLEVNQLGKGILKNTIVTN